eukprot:gene4942-15204_t
MYEDFMNVTLEELGRATTMMIQYLRFQKYSKDIARRIRWYYSMVRKLQAAIRGSLARREVSKIKMIRRWDVIEVTKQRQVDQRKMLANKTTRGASEVKSEAESARTT